MRAPSVLSGLAIGLIAAATLAHAQQPPREGPRTSLHQAQAAGATTEPRIEVASVILAAPASEVTLSIAVVPQSAVPLQSFVRIRGLPPMTALSEGHAIQPGAWAVPLTALANLRIIVPAGLSGKREVTISLVTGDGAILAEAKAALVIAAAGLITPDEKPSPPPQAVPSLPPPLIAGPALAVPPPAQKAAPPPDAPPATPAAAPPPSPPPPPAQPPPPELAKKPAPPPPVVAALPPPEPVIAPKPKGPPPMAPEARRRAEQYLDRAGKLLRDGDVASARLFLQRAADEGLADAALAMGGTFDRDELARLKAHGIRPDPAEARRWYERAAELGSGEAQDRLKRLGAR